MINLTLSSFAYLVLTVITYRSYREWQFRPLLYIMVAMLFLMVSTLLDSIARTELVLVTPSLIKACIRLSGVFFYLGAFCFIRGVITLRDRIYWDLLLIYSAFYGAMILFYSLPGYSRVLYNAEDNMWIIIYNSTGALLEVLTMIPVLDLVQGVARRIFSGQLNLYAKRTIYFLILGILVPLIGSLLSFVFPSVLMITFNNICLTVCAVIVVFALVNDPLLFSLSNSVLFQIMIISKENNLPFASYVWERGQVDLDMTSLAFSGTTHFLSEITENQGTKGKQSVEYIKLKTTQIFVNESFNLTGFLIAKHGGKACQIALRRLVSRCEQYYVEEENSLNKKKHLPESLFYEEISRIFTFPMQKQ